MSASIRGQVADHAADHAADEAVGQARSTTDRVSELSRAALGRTVQNALAEVGACFVE